MDTSADPSIVTFFVIVELVLIACSGYLAFEVWDVRSVRDRLLRAVESLLLLGFMPVLITIPEMYKQMVLIGNIETILPYMRGVGYTILVINMMYYVYLYTHRRFTGKYRTAEDRSFERGLRKMMDDDDWNKGMRS